MQVTFVMKIIVDLPQDQVTALGAFCKTQGISRADAIRRAVADMLERSAGDGRGKAFGAWSGSSLKAAEYVLEVRDEWGP